VAFIVAVAPLFLFHSLFFAGEAHPLPSQQRRDALPKITVPYITNRNQMKRHRCLKGKGKPPTNPTAAKKGQERRGRVGREPFFFFLRLQRRNIALTTPDCRHLQAPMIGGGAPRTGEGEAKRESKQKKKKTENKRRHNKANSGEKGLRSSNNSSDAYVRAATTPDTVRISRRRSRQEKKKRSCFLHPTFPSLLFFAHPPPPFVEGSP
jgi:hypothetical protein